jgi:hypothetical protein
MEVYPGQMVDVYIGARDATAVSLPSGPRLKSPLIEYTDERKVSAPPALAVKRP